MTFHLDMLTYFVHVSTNLIIDLQLAYVTYVFVFILLLIMLYSTAPPKINVDPKLTNISVKAGTKIAIEATVTGSPAAVTTWCKGDTPIESTKRFKIEAGKGPKASIRLTIDKTERSDLGTYTLTAANDLGTDTAIITIIVLGKK